MPSPIPIEKVPVGRVFVMRYADGSAGDVERVLDASRVSYRVDRPGQRSYLPPGTLVFLLEDLHPEPEISSNANR